MKKFLIISLLLLLILTSIFTTVNAVTITDDSFSNTISKFNTILENRIDTDNPGYLSEILDDNNNVPAYSYYSNHVASRGIKALKAYNGKIFMGLGDWNDNTGPVKILYYDTGDGKIKTSGKILDEAVENFEIINGNLYTTGCDPKAGWGYGSYYTYNEAENKWDQHENNNGWVHVLTIKQFKDKIFMGGEILQGTRFSHIQFSTDNGETFQNTKIVKNGEDASSFPDLRCWNLSIYNDNIYAFIRHFDGSITTYQRNISI